MKSNTMWEWLQSGGKSRCRPKGVRLTNNDKKTRSKVNGVEKGEGANVCMCCQNMIQG